MNDNLKFINHLNEVVEFNQNGVVIDENDFRDYEWSYTKQYNKIVSWSRTITKKKITMKIYGENQTALRNQIFETLEKDVLASKNGKLYVGDYYIEGYFYASDKSDYTTGSYTTIKLQFVTDEAYWKKESYYLYRIEGYSGGTNQSTGTPSYPYDYAYDYASSISIGQIVNESFVPVNFKAIIYGPVVNPSIVIGGNIYKVNVSLINNEYLTINTLKKTITKTSSNGTITNCFYLRDMESDYIFEKIPVGSQSFIANPETNVDITLFEERSEPKWT